MPLTFPACPRIPDLGRRILVMGILNVTPDSFSDGGRYDARDAATAHARRMLDQGADIIVGAQGATLANLLWVKLGALVIELMSEDGRNSSGLHWAAEAGMDYVPYSARRKAGSNPSPSTRRPCSGASTASPHNAVWRFKR